MTPAACGYLPVGEELTAIESGWSTQRFHAPGHIMEDGPPQRQRGPPSLYPIVTYYLGSVSALGIGRVEKITSPGRSIGSVFSLP
jgi:hypothetical protein